MEGIEVRLMIREGHQPRTKPGANSILAGFLMCAGICLGPVAFAEDPPGGNQPGAREQSPAAPNFVEEVHEETAPDFDPATLGESGSPAGLEEAPSDLLDLPPGLIDHAAPLDSTNVVRHPHTGHRKAADNFHQSQLDQATEYRKQGNFNLAANLCTALIEGSAPVSFKRAALIELAVIAEAQNQPGRAIQIYAQFLKRFPGDASIPEVFLRQGLLYRQMGAPVLALSKFYAVLSSSITSKSANLQYVQRLVLQAQLEIADTYFGQGKLKDASDFYLRLLKQEPPGLNAGVILHKLVRCQAGLTNHSETITHGELFLRDHADAEPAPEVRFLVANALTEVGRKSEALTHVQALLESQQSLAKDGPTCTNWVYWQQRAGNLVANQLYLEGDYHSALLVYSRLAELSLAPEWQWPVWYQIGLVCEKLHQPEQALDTYRKILDRQKDLATPPATVVKTVVDMARWRTDFLNWQLQAQAGPAGTSITNSQAKADSPLSALP